jgi:hypothetical protein
VSVDDTNATAAGRAIAEATLEAWAEAGHRIRWPVEGSSMWPVLRPGDTIVIAHGDCDLRRGDLVAYCREGRVVIHRLLRRQGAGRLLTAGDAQPETDPPVPADAVLGRVVAIQASGGEFGLTGGLARLAGGLLAASHPLRGRRGLRKIAAGLAWIGAWAVRR